MIRRECPRWFDSNHVNLMENKEQKLVTLTEEELESIKYQAFFDGANYIFVRLGNWQGKGINFYSNYFKQCAEIGVDPILTSMIVEEVVGMAHMYMKGWRPEFVRYPGQKVYQKKDTPDESVETKRSE
jgi:hypothetical protein